MGVFKQSDLRLTAHNIHLTNSISTLPDGIGERVHQHGTVFAEIYKYHSQIFSAEQGLDLGYLEGGISIDLALLGAKTTGLDVRQQHIAKAKFASSELGLRRKCKWILADITER